MAGVVTAPCSKKTHPQGLQRRESLAKGEEMAFQEQGAAHAKALFIFLLQFTFNVIFYLIE